MQSKGTNIQLEDSSVDLILLVTVYHEIGESEVVLKEFNRILKPSGKLAVVEVIKKGILPGAPVQNPEALKAEFEAGNFEVKQVLPAQKLRHFHLNQKSLTITLLFSFLSFRRISVFRILESRFTGKRGEAGAEANITV